MISFGASGWRTVAGDGFTKHNVQALTRAVAQIMKDSGTYEQGFVIGYDWHFLSKEAAKWAAEVMAGEEISCRVIKNDAPASLVMFTVKQMKLDFGMAFTAGHNSDKYSGIKTFTRGGRDADEAEIYNIEMYINEYEPEPIVTMNYDEGILQGLIQEIDPFDDYMASVLNILCTGGIRQRKIKVVLASTHDESGIPLKAVLMAAGCDVSVIYCDMQVVERASEPNMQILDSLESYLLENNCELGAAIYGDTDNIAVIDDKGNIVHPNEILVMLYYYLLKYKGWRGPCVRNNSTTHLLDKVAESFNEKCYEVPVGFKYISAKMEQTNALIGGESSGGIAVRGHIPGNDGMFAAALLTEMIAVTGKTISELHNEITQVYGAYYFNELNLSLTYESKKQITQKLFIDKLLPDLPLEVARVSYLDGCKVYFKNGGFAIIRLSGTEQALRVCTEMPDRENLANICRIISSFIHSL